MSGEEGRRLGNQDLHVVKNLIERCIQLYMSRKEVVSVLSSEASVAPAVTELLWQRLEEENREFFEVYYIKLALKEQVQRFNELLKQQAVLMEKIQSAGGSPMTVSSNGSSVPQFQQNAGCYGIDQTGPSMRPESLQPPIGSTLPGSFANGVSHLQAPSSFDLSTSSRPVDCLPDTLNVSNSNSIRMMHGLNGGIVKSESGYPSDSPLFYDADPHLGEVHGSMEDASVTTFSGMEASSQPLNETLLGMNGSFGQLEHMPKIFSLPDLAYNVLDNYTNTAFMTSETENFLDSRDRGDIPGEDNKVAMTDNYNNYEEFGSE